MSRLQFVADNPTTSEVKRCGAPWITAELSDGKLAGGRVNHKRVAVSCVLLASPDT